MTKLKTKTKTNENLRYEVITQEDPESGDLILPIPQPLLDSLSWKEGDELEISVTPAGGIVIRKVDTGGSSVIKKVIGS